MKTCGNTGCSTDYPRSRCAPHHFRASRLLTDNNPRGSPRDRLRWASNSFNQLRERLILFLKSCFFVQKCYCVIFLKRLFVENKRRLS